MIFTPNYIAIGEYFDKNKGKAMGVATVGSGIGAIIMPPLWTFMFNYYGYFGTMLIVGGLYLNNIVAGGVFRKLRKPRVKSHKVEITTATTTNMGHKGESESDTIGEHNHMSTTTATMTQDMSHKGKSESDTIGEHNHMSTTTATMTQNMSHKGESDSDTTGRHNNKSTTKTTEQNKSHKDKKDSDTTEKHNHDKSTTTRKTPIHGLSSASNAGHHGVHMLHAVTSKLRLLCNIGFLIHVLTIASIPFALQATVNFLPSWADEVGLTETQSSLLVMITGATDIIGRIAFGFIFDHRLVIHRRQICYKWLSILFGLSTIVICFCESMTTLIVACVFWGFFEAGSHGQRVTVVSEFVTAAQMPDAVGVLILFQGLGALLSPLVSGNILSIICIIRFGIY